MAKFSTGCFEKDPANKDQALARAAFYATRLLKHERRIQNMNDQIKALEEKMEKLQKTKEEVQKALEECLTLRTNCTSYINQLKTNYQLTDAEIEALRTELLVSQIRELEAQKDFTWKSEASVPGKDPGSQI